MKIRTLSVVALLLGLAGCEDRAYVSPATVLLSITNVDSGVERVHRCNYVPVLLGSEVRARYVVEGELKATISLNREKVTVSFEGADDLPEPWSVDSSDFDAKVTEVSETPPKNFDVELSSACVVEEP